MSLRRSVALETGTNHRFLLPVCSKRRPIFLHAAMGNGLVGRVGAKVTVADRDVVIAGGLSGDRGLVEAAGRVVTCVPGHVMWQPAAHGAHLGVNKGRVLQQSCLKLCFPPPR